MGALIEINTDGLAKLAETVCHGLGITAFGNKKMADAELIQLSNKQRLKLKLLF